VQEKSESSSIFQPRNRAVETTIQEPSVGTLGKKDLGDATLERFRDGAIDLATIEELIEQGVLP
jgi:hypothetical protein